MSSLVCVLLSALVVSGLAADPPKPSQDSTFMASGEVEQHLPEMTVFGTFEFAVDYTNNKAYQRETYDFIGTSQTRVILQIPDKKSNVTCYLRNSVCTNETRPSGALPLDYWGWLQYATYEGKTSIRHITYDLWGYSVGGLRLEVLVEENKNRTIKYFNRKSAEVSVNYSLEFKTPKFTNSTFEVPKACL